MDPRAGECLLSVLGDPLLSDRLERIAFNALPATFKPDMWAHQYDQQVNQVLCSVAERDWSNSPDANIFGLEPNFGCCTANMHQGWPKFAASLWMATNDGGLVVVAYAPCEVSTTIAGTEVTIVEETDYPFGDTVQITVRPAAELKFPLYLRVPGWAAGAQVKLPDGQLLDANAGSYHKIERLWHPADVIALTLPAELSVERRYNGSVAINRGPLLFSLKMEEKWQLIGGSPPHGDWEVYPLSAWNYGLVVDTSLPGQSIKVNSKAPAENSFSPEGAPLSLDVRGRLLPGLKLEGGSAGPIPHSPTRSTEPLKDLTLLPYGCTNLRMTEFPLLED